jgi:hypothetical protein
MDRRARQRRRVEIDACHRRAASTRPSELRALAKRLIRRCPTLTKNEAAEAAARIADFMGDHLPLRDKPTIYRGWREDVRRRACFFGFLYYPGQGLPLAAEGGVPLRCADRITSDLSRKNYMAARASEAA